MTRTEEQGRARKEKRGEKKKRGGGGEGITEEKE